MIEDNEEFNLFRNENMNIIDKELKEIQMSLVLMDTVENDPAFILN